MDPLGDVRARGDGESVNSVAVKSPTAGSQMNNNFVSIYIRYDLWYFKTYRSHL